jgi:hypothetical protein
MSSRRVGGTDLWVEEGGKADGPLLLRIPTQSIDAKSDWGLPQEQTSTYDSLGVKISI